MTTSPLCPQPHLPTSVFPIPLSTHPNCNGLTWVQEHTGRPRPKSSWYCGTWHPLFSPPAHIQLLHQEGNQVSETWFTLGKTMLTAFGHFPLLVSQKCHPRGLQLMTHSSPKWPCAACDSLGGIFGLFLRWVQHWLVLTHKRPLPIPSPFRRDIPKKYRSSLVNSLQLSAFYTTYLISLIFYIFTPVHDTMTISTVTFSDADCLGKGPLHCSPVFFSAYFLFIQIPLTYPLAALTPQS